MIFLTEGLQQAEAFLLAGHLSASAIVSLSESEEVGVDMHE
jgi:hypothetical protein